MSDLIPNGKISLSQPAYIDLVKNEASKVSKEALDRHEARRSSLPAKPPVRVDSTSSASPATKHFDTPKGPRHHDLNTAVTASPGLAVDNGAFCSIYEDPDNPGDYYLRGGPVQVGDKNFDVPNKLINGSDGTYRYYISSALEVFRTDDGNYLMSGVKTTTETSLSITEATGAYPSNTDPTIASVGIGSIKFLIGRADVVSGVPTISPASCGGFLAKHCGGGLSYERV